MNVLTEYQIHQAALLTMRGWICDEHNVWRKANVTHLVAHEWSLCRDTESDEWTRDDAYWEATYAG